VRKPIPPLLGSILLSFLCACGEQAPSGFVFEHYPAVSQGLAAAEKAVAESAEAPPAAAQEVDPQHVAGLVHMLANSRGRTRELPLEEIVTLGDGAAPPLAVIAANSEQGENERRAACELLSRLATPLATEHLLQLFEHSPESWIRAQAAWRLGSLGHDWVIPRMLRRFKYEKDEQTVIWMSDALAKLGNYHGLDVLWQLAETAATEELRAAAAERLNTIAAGAECETPRELWDLWFVADADRRLYRESPSPRLVLATWREIEQLSGEHFQLRGVDESRFVLSRLGAWATEPLTSALHDEDVYVRVHAAQVIERMGLRGVEAGPSLVEALSDPTLATEAAAALGSIGYAGAEPVMRALLEDTATDHELRVACAASLGRLGIPASLEALFGQLDSGAPLDLEQTAADALVRMGSEGAATQFLFRALSNPAADRPGAESSLERWLANREGDDAEALRAAWAALAPPAGVIHTTEEAARRREARKQLLEKSGLFGE